jgi:hypothetical protein
VQDYIDTKKTDYRDPFFYLVNFLETGKYGERQRYDDALTIFGYSFQDLEEYRAIRKTGIYLAQEIMARSATK